MCIFKNEGNPSINTYSLIDTSLDEYSLSPVYIDMTLTYLGIIEKKIVLEKLIDFFFA